MKKRQVKQKAKDIVLSMLNGRCIPEDSDVGHVSDDPQEIESLKHAIQEVLDQLCKTLTR